MSNFYKDAMNIPIVGAEYGFNGVVDPEYARGHRDALVAASKIALDADAKIDGLETDLVEAQAEITSFKAQFEADQAEIAELTSEYQTWREACFRARARADAAQAEITRLWQIAYNGEYSKARNWGADALRVAGESSLEDIIRKAKEE